MSHDEKSVAMIVDLLKSESKAFNIKMLNKKKGKLKPYSIKVEPIGLCILSKKKSRKKDKIKHFISYLEIFKINFVGKKQIEIFSKSPFSDKSTDIISIEGDQDSIENLVKSTNENYLQFCSDSRLFTEIALTQPPDGFDIRRSKKTGTPHQTALRYLAACAQFDEPVDRPLLELFQSYTKNHETYKIKFTGNFATPQNYKVIALPLVHELNLKILVFDNFAPQNVCKIIHYILKHNKKITTIILKNYEDINYHLFGFDKLANPSVISWAFCNLTFSDNSEQLTFLQQFASYQGFIQKLTLEQFTFNAALLKEITKFVPNCYCFRTLEILEIRQPNFQSRRTEEIQRSLRDFTNIASSLKVLHTFEVTGWSSIYPSAIFCSSTLHNQNIMFASTSLRHISFSNLDFRKVNFSFNFPILLNVVELEKCYFNSLSLLNLLKAAGEIRSPLILDLSLMKIDDNEKFLFYRKLASVPRLKNLIELDYSYNVIPPQFVRVFCKTFLPSTIKFLNVSNCFELDKQSQTLPPAFQFVIKHLYKSANIWGLEIRSNIPQKTDFSTKFDELFTYLIKMKSIEHLDIGGHRWLNTFGSEKLIEKLRQMTNLKYLNIEGAGFTEIDPLLQFYYSILNQMNLEGINLPSGDIDYISKHSDVQSQINGMNESDSYKNLKDKMKNKTFPSTRVQRSCYYMRYTDMTKIPEFLTKFPVAMTTLKGVRHAQELITFNPRQFEIRTLLDFEMKEMNEKEYDLSSYQVTFLESPIEDVEVKQQIIPQFETQTRLMKYKPKYNPLLANNRPVPVIPPKINPLEIISKYRGWICHKNQNLFSNLTLIPGLFEKVINDETASSNSLISSDEFGSTIPIIEPPTFVPRKAISIINTQLENLGTNIEDNGDERSLFSRTTIFYEEKSAISQRSSATKDTDPNSNSFFSQFTSTSTSHKKSSSENEDNSLSGSKRVSLKSSSRDSTGPGKTKNYTNYENHQLSTIRMAAHKFCLNNFSLDEGQYDLIEDDEEIDYSDVVSQRGENNFTALTVQQYTNKKASLVNVDPKQQAALDTIKTTATSLSEYPTPRSTIVKALPAKVESLAPQRMDPIDILSSFTQQYCSNVIANPGQAQQKPVKSIYEKPIAARQAEVSKKQTPTKQNAMGINLDEMISRRGSNPHVSVPQSPERNRRPSMIQSSESDDEGDDNKSVKLNTPFIPPPLSPVGASLGIPSMQTPAPVSPTPPSLSAGIPPPLQPSLPSLQPAMPPPLQAGIPPPLSAGIPPPLQAGIPPPLSAGIPPPLQAGVPSMPPPLQPSLLPMNILQQQTLSNTPSAKPEVPSTTPSFTPEINPNPKRDYEDVNSFDVPDELPTIENDDPSSIDPAPNSLVCEYSISPKPELPNLDSL